EMRRYPVEDDAEPRLVRRIDEVLEPGRIAEARSRRVEARRLIPPALIERVLGDRQQLEMREAHVLGIGNELLGELVVAHEVTVGALAPRAQMDLVDRDRRTPPILLAALLDILAVAPVERRRIGDDRGRAWPELGLPRKRVG